MAKIRMGSICILNQNVYSDATATFALPFVVRLGRDSNPHSPLWAVEQPRLPVIGLVAVKSVGWLELVGLIGNNWFGWAFLSVFFLK